MLKWVDGPRDRGCEYHKKAVFRFPSANGQVDVFVMPAIARARPVAITNNVTTRKDRKETLKDAVATRAGLAGLRARHKT